jgi:Fe-S oxidoreductase
MDEEHSTRGRARLLFEMLHGHDDSPITDGWRSRQVRDALDLCLSCKGCKSDCPVNVDMATYKAEFLAQHYRHRLRPRAHYALGWLPAAAAAVDAARIARPLNAATRRRPIARLATRAAGLAPRQIPPFATTSLQRWIRRRTPPANPGTRGHVLLFPDTFTNHFHPEVGQAAVEVLEHAGWRVTVPAERMCCGLTWISTGQLDTARRVLRRTVGMLAEHVRSGGFVVGLEPSCTTVFRSDATELISADLDVRRLADRTVTLAELLTEHSDGWQPPHLAGVQAIAQVHCHQHAVLGWDADERLLRAAGVDVQRLDSGCCGLAGNFGFERGHLDVSVACAEQVLLPAVRAAGESTRILADGFSCRVQIDELAQRRAGHLAQLLAEAYRRR